MREREREREKERERERDAHFKVTHFSLLRVLMLVPVVQTIVRVKGRSKGRGQTWRMKMKM